MPRCFVERCHNYGGRRLNIILHSFPNNLEKIKTWLRCIEQSGHVIIDIEELAERIFEGKTNNRFRVCSEHFTEQSYQPSGLRKTLRKDAVPTIFRDVPPQKCPWQKVKPALKSTKVDSPASAEPNCRTAHHQHRQNVFHPVPISPSVHLDPHRCEQVNMETTIKSHEYFQQNPKQTKGGYSLGTKTTDVTRAILKFTLEIICLLTGEEYIVVKKTSNHVEGWSRTQSPILESPPDSLIDVKNSEQKILEVTYKIIGLLTGEACEGLEEHQKSSSMESHQALTYLDNMVNGLSDHTSARAMEESLSSDEKEEIHTPTDHRPQYLFSNIKVEASYDGRSIRDSVDDTQHYPSPSIKEEPVYCGKANVTDPDIHAPTDHEQQPASTHIKEEAVPCESRNLSDSNNYTPTDHAQQYPSLIKEEPMTYSGGNLTDSNVYTPTDHVVCASMEETSSCDGGSVTNPIDHVQQHPTNHVLAEPVLCDKVRAINATMNTEARSSSHTESENEDVQKNYSLFDKGNLDTDIYALIKHAQAKYTFTRIEDGSSSEGEENLKDVDSHTSADHTPRPTNGTGEAVPQTIQCPECSECFTRKSALINHRRTHRQEKLTCSKCGKVFSKRSSLQNHLTLHTGERPFACPICGKCFARKSNLISHETIHSGKASFICAECGRYFVCKVHLTKHQIIHEK